MNLEAIKKGIQHRKEVVFPFTQEKCFIRVLNEYDEMCACQYIDEKYKGREINYSNSDERKSLKCSYQLWLSLEKENEEKLFERFEDFLKYITSEGINRLYSDFVVFQKECNPPVDEMTHEEVSQMVDILKKKPETVWKISDIRLLMKCLFFLVSQP